MSAYTAVENVGLALSSKGRPKKIAENEKSVLRQIVTDKPVATTAEVQAEFTRRTGIRAHAATIRKGLREAAVRRGQGKVVRQQQSTEQPVRYGYQPCHRGQRPRAALRQLSHRCRMGAGRRSVRQPRWSGDAAALFAAGVG